MKTKRVFILLIVLITVLISSCGLFLGTSKEERLVEFKSDLNGSRDGIWDNFHSDCAQLSNISTVAYWNNDGNFFDDAKKPFVFSIPSDPSDVETISVTHALGSNTYVFTMENEGNFFSGDDWRIRKLAVDGSTQID